VTGGDPARERRLALLRRVRVYLVAGEASCRGPFLAAVERALSSGVVGAVQLREKDLSDDAFLARAVALRGLAERAGALLLLNDRAHLVAEAGADGVHVGEDDPSPESARALAGASALVGLSTHDAAEVAAAPARGADYVGLGPCFPTATKALARAPRGPDLLREALPSARLPVFPIGGITPDNVASLAAAGATRVAVGAGILSAPDPAAAARAVAAALSCGA
jgi:thiamine-phosphate pyrophosphorylase